MPTTLNDVALNPDSFSHEIELGQEEKALFRPLKNNDIQSLAKFLEGLSMETRRLSTFPSYDEVTAKELCSAINRYDKLCFVLELPTREIVGLIEFSFDLPESDVARFKRFNLKSATDCRFGPTLADKYQDRAIGSLLIPYIIDMAKQFGKKRIILYGGVLADNSRAIGFYRKHGFVIAGEFTNSGGKKSLDMIKTLV